MLVLAEAYTVKILAIQSARGNTPVRSWEAKKPTSTVSEMPFFRVELIFVETFI
jgi:hypothetical protein